MYRYRILLCGLLALAIVILSSCGGTTQPAGSATPASSAVSTTVTPATAPAAGGVLATANDYYKAVEARNYTKAYSYMDPGVTSPLQPRQLITQDQYTRLAQAVDLTAGPVVSYIYIADSSDPTMVVLTVARKQGLRYHSHLKMKQVGGAWKIISFDTI